MNKILDSVNCNFSDKELKKIIYYFSENRTKSVYEYFRSEVQEEEIKTCEGMDGFLFDLFKHYQEKRRNIPKEDSDALSIETEENIIKNITLENYNSIKEFFSSDEFKRIMNKPIWPQDRNENSRFIHVTNNCLKEFEIENYDCRLYLSPQMKNIIPIVNEIIQKHNEFGLSCYLKFNTNSADNDRIILYSSLDNIDKHLEIIQNVKNKHKELFENMGNNKLWGKIENIDGIYFGVEPFLYECTSSYGSIRSTIIDEALLDFFNKYDDYSKNEEITSEMLDYFKKKIRLHSVANNVNPDNFCLNMQNEKKHKTPIRLAQNSNKPLSVIVNYIHPNDDTVTISAPKYYMDDDNLLNISLEELELLYKKDRNDKNYDQSNEVRKEIYNKLEKIHKKNKIDSTLNRLNLIKRYKEKMMVQTTYNNKVLTNGGCINYNLYKVLPLKVSELLCLIKLRKENRRNGIVIVKTTEEISKSIDDITSNDPLEVKAVVSVVEEEFFNRELAKEEEVESVKKR